MSNKEIISSKIFTRERLSNMVQKWKADGKNVVFTNGCFDILHLGHADYLSKAAELGDILIVGLNTDDSVRRLKGNSRPINNQDARAFLLASFFYVDAVVLFDENTPLELIKETMPNILVKGNDYSEDQIVGGSEVKAAGGKVLTLNLVEGYATSAIEKKILALHQK